MSFKNINPLIIGDLVMKAPIIQGGMGIKVSTSSLASAVANCGGAGTIASVALGYGTEENETNFVKASSDALRREIRNAKKLTDGVVGVNIMIALSNHAELASVASEENADFIASGAGLPLRLPEYVTNPSVKLIPIVSSARAFELITRGWSKKYNRFPDAVILEGPEAGGHLGFKFDELTADPVVRVEDLLRELVISVKRIETETGRKIPIIAGGGIYTGADIGRILNMGASGVQMGTRFVATDECSVDEAFKQLYISAGEDDVVLIKSPVGMPGRAVRTSFVDRIVAGERTVFRCNYKCLHTCSPQNVQYCIAKALFNASIGNLDEAVVFAGSCVSRVDRIVPVRELMDELLTEADMYLDKAGKSAI
jgi:nitronate monooxygenase